MLLSGGSLARHKAEPDVPPETDRELRPERIPHLNPEREREGPAKLARDAREGRIRASSSLPGPVWLVTLVTHWLGCRWAVRHTNSSAAEWPEAAQSKQNRGPCLLFSRGHHRLRKPLQQLHFQSLRKETIATTALHPAPAASK
jgi:hypothetical protein